MMEVDLDFDPPPPDLVSIPSYQLNSYILQDRPRTLTAFRKVGNHGVPLPLHEVGFCHLSCINHLLGGPTHPAGSPSL